MDKREPVPKKYRGARRLILLVVGFVVATGFYHWQNAGSGEAMREVASELGLELSRESQRWTLRGRVDDIGIEVKTTTENSAGETCWYTDFKLYAAGQPQGRIVGANLRQKVIGGVKDSDWLRTGDAEFDKAVLVEGDPAVMLAHLGPEARVAIQAATRAGWALESATWSARESGRVSSSQKIRSLLDLGMAAARSTRLENDVAASARDRDENGKPGNAENLPAPVTTANALEGLAEVNTPRSLEAALFLARAGDDRQEVRNRLVSALLSGERIDEVIALLGEVGGQLELAVLSSVTGEHEEAAKSAIAAIKQRL